jgi:LacI family transcriptional regulator
VSYALRGHPSISSATTKKVQAAARQLGWTRDATLHLQMAIVRTTLARTDLPNLAVLLDRTPEKLASLGTIRRHLEGVTARAEELGFAINLFNLADQRMKPRRLAAVMQARGIRGLILIDPELSLPRTYLSLAADFVTVSIGVDPDHRAVDVAISDYLSIGRRGVRELTRLGFKRPGMVLPRGTEQLLHYGFTGGFHAGIATLPRSDQLPICYCTQDLVYLPESVFGEIHTWLDQHKPDVLLGIDTLGLSKAVAASRLSAVPIYSLDWHPGEDAVGGIDQRPAAIGRAGVNLVVGQLDRGGRDVSAPKLTVLVEESWVPGLPEKRVSKFGRARRT